MTLLASKEKPAVDPELTRLVNEDSAAWESYGESVLRQLSPRLRRSRLRLALATLNRLRDYELTHNGTKAVDGSD